MNRYANVFLIARRDFMERVGTKAFKFGTLIMALAVAASVVLPALLTDDEAPVRTVAIAGPAPTGLSEAIVQTGASTGIDVRVDAVDDVNAGEELLRTDKASVVLVPGDEVITRAAISDSAAIANPTARVAASVNELARLYSGLENAGLDGQQTQAVVDAAPLQYRGLEAAGETPASESGESTGVVIAVFIFLLIYTAWVVNSVIEEKTSRVVEVLLSTIKARELLTGKVLGTALVAGLQGVVLVATVLVAQAAVEGQASASIGLSLESLLYGLMWLILGYALYAWLYAAAGSLASRSQDAQTLTFPIQIPLLIGYFVSVGSAVGGTSTVLTVMSFVPFTAPMAMLTRMTIGDAAAWEVAIALGLTGLAATLAMKLTVVIYTGAILRTGQRTKLREAWRSARG